MELAIGVDVNHKLEAADRMNNALQAAHLAARAGQKTRLANEEFVKEKARRLKLLSAIDRAMLTGTLEVWFQPKLTLSNHEVIGAEALLRWGNEEAIDATTSEIITLAEEHGRIDELTIYVLNLAMEQIMRALAQSQKFKLAVNISAHTLQSSTIVHHVDRLSARHGFPLERLILEVTETTPLADKLTLETIKELQRRGVSFSIDDFGTGRSSLDYLLRVPSEELKIDQTFIKAMMHADNMEAVVKATIEMSHAFGKAVVAEGVEDEVTAKRLTKMGCDLGQGFFFSPALPIEHLLRVMHVGRAEA
jgi:EAL domain-containing protein (putative c-di-GMP-specific phosphodiesterase class I)